MAMVLKNIFILKTGSVNKKVLNQVNSCTVSVVFVFVFTQCFTHSTISPKKWFVFAFDNVLPNIYVHVCKSIPSIEKTVMNVIYLYAIPMYLICKHIQTCVCSQIQNRVQ